MFLFNSLSKGIPPRGSCIQLNPSSPSHHPPSHLPAAWTHFLKVTLSGQHHKFQGLLQGSAWEFCDTGPTS